MKLNIAFCNTGCIGHSIPTIAVAKKFKEKGHNVIYLVLDISDEILNTLLQNNFEVISIFDNNIRKKSLNELKDIKEISLAIAEICKNQNIDIIFTGDLFPAGSIAGDFIDIPVIKIFPNPYIYTENNDSPLINSSGGTFFSNERFCYFQYINFVRYQLKLNVLSSDDLILSKFANLILVDKDVPNLKQEYYNNNVKILGPIVNYTNNFLYNHHIFSWLKKDTKKIFISLGTEITKLNNVIQFYKKIINTFSAYNNNQIQVILYIGPRPSLKKEQYNNNSTNCIILDGFIPQLEIISSVDLVITHGGWNTVHESLYYCKPIIIFPYEGHHFQTANWIEGKKLGLQMNFHNFNENELRNNTMQLIESYEVKEKLIKYALELRSEKRINNMVEYLLERFDCVKKN